MKKIAFAGTDGRTLLWALVTATATSEVHTENYEGIVVRGTPAMPKFVEEMKWPVQFVETRSNSVDDYARGILDASLFARMKHGAHLVNVGRGGHLREPDLVDALAGGRLAGATLDVLSEEPPAADSPLWTAPNLTLTPHVASISDPAVVARQVVENLGRLQRGEPLLHPVDPARHY